MSESNWRDLLSPRCLYVYSNDTETIRSEEFVRAVDGVVQAISVPDPADQRGGNRLLVLLNNEENKKHLENQGIIYQGRHLNVESSNNTCDIPNEWERFVDGAFQQLMQYPSGQQSAQENDVYANMPSVQNIPMPSPQHYMGQQMAATPGQQNPMNPGHIPFMHPFYMQGMPPNMYPQEGAVGQNVPPEAGNFPNPQQLWLQQMQHMQQMIYQMHGGMPGTEGATAAQPPPYTPTEEKSSSMRDSLESTATKLKQSYSDLQSSDGESVTPSAPDEEVQEADESEQETSKSEAAMIKVTNIPDGTSKDALLFFFENRRKSGGGSVDDLEYDPDTKSAVITFEEPEAVKRVLGKLPILFNGVQIGVEEFRPDVRVEDYSEEAGEDSENILEVRGVSSKTSEDTVMMYFENTRRSGGGEIKSMKSEDDGVFYIIFEDDQAIEKVLKKHHKIDGTAIEVCRYVPPPPPKPVPMYSNKVFITNISEKTTRDGLENFLEAKTNITPASIEYGELEGTVLITFEEDIDFEKLQLACKKRTLDKSHLEISRVPITNCAIVRNISERTSRDTLEFYFDNEKRSGVSGVLDVKMLDGFCLVYFEEPEAVDVVCRRPHRIDEQDLDVKIYYECLGQVESDDEPFKTPASLEISDFDPKKLQFLIKSPSNQKAVEKQLEAVYGKPIWPKKSKSNSLTVECTLTPETKDCRKIARHWETKVKENLSKFLDLLHVCKHTTLQEAFPLVLSELKSLTISNPDAVAVVLEKSNHEIYVTGHKQAVTDLSKQVSDIIQKVDQELDRKKQQMQEEKHLKRHLVLMLQFCKFEQQLQKKYKDISLKYDISKNLVKFEGLSGEVISAIVEMYEFTSKVVKTEVKQFSKLLKQFLQQQPVYMYVNSKMKERNIIGIWEFCKKEETLTVFSMSDEQAVQAAHLIKESVKETPIQLKNESKALLPTREWQSKVEEIENNGQGLIKIIAQTDQGRIIILCTDQWEGLAREYIDDFMLANTIYEESLNLELAMMKYLQLNCAGDLDDVSRSLESEKVKVEVRDSGIVIKATKTGLNQAKFAIDKIVQGVNKQTHSINKAGIRKHMSDIILRTNAEYGYVQGPDVSGVSDIAMSQHYVDCQTCGGYSDFYCNACHKRMCGKCRDEHLKHPDNAKHDVCKYEDRKFVFSSVPCKAHPKHQMVLCCKKCQQAICALCTTKEHEGHGFLDLEEVYTKKYKTRTEEIRRIRNEFLLNSRLRLKESRNATLELKGNLELMRNSMKEQASQIKELVDAILTENLHDLHSYEASAVEKLENQEKVLDTYVTHVQDTCKLEEYKNSMFFGNPVEFLSGINDTLDVKFEPIPDVQKLSPGNFSEGKLNKEEIRKQFGVLTKPSNET